MLLDSNLLPKHTYSIHKPRLTPPSKALWDLQDALAAGPGLPPLEMRSTLFVKHLLREPTDLSLRRGQCKDTINI